MYFTNMNVVCISPFIISWHLSLLEILHDNFNISHFFCTASNKKTRVFLCLFLKACEFWFQCSTQMPVFPLFGTNISAEETLKTSTIWWILFRTSHCKTGFLMSFSLIFFLDFPQTDYRDDSWTCHKSHKRVITHPGSLTFSDYKKNLRNIVNCFKIFFLIGNGTGYPRSIQADSTMSKSCQQFDGIS